MLKIKEEKNVYRSYLCIPIIFTHFKEICIIFDLVTKAVLTDIKDYAINLIIKFDNLCMTYKVFLAKQVLNTQVIMNIYRIQKNRVKKCKLIFLFRFAMNLLFKHEWVLTFLKYYFGTEMSTWLFSKISVQEITLNDFLILN